jgi:CheY-like chemotaxis protein
MPAMRVLVVDDHADTLKVMVRLLTAFGHEVTTASTVAMAAEKGGGFDLLITDLGLPDGSGVDVLKNLRQHGQVPAIVISGYGSADDIRTCTEAGFNRHLTKPIDLMELKATIDQVVSR